MKDIKTNQYSERDIMELDHIGNHYSIHLSAMTSEQLHSKSDVAAELAFRDCEIDSLVAENESLREQIKATRKELAGRKLDSVASFGAWLVNNHECRFSGGEIEIAELCSEFAEAKLVITNVINGLK